MKDFYIIVSIIFLLLLANISFAETKPKIAIMDLEGKGVTTEEAEAVSDFLRTDLVNTKKFTVVERDRLKDILKEQELSLTGLTETEKATKIGKLLNCKFIMVGTLSKLGRKYFLNVRVVDVETGETTLGKRQSSSRIEDLSEVSKSIANQLAGIENIPGEKGKSEVKYRNPKLGFDFQIGFAGSSKGYEDYKELNTNYESESYFYPALLDLRFGVYISFLYLGMTGKKFTLEAGNEVEVTKITNGVAKPTTTEILSSDYKLSFGGLCLGIRASSKGKIDPKILYFGRIKASVYDSNNEKVYSGPYMGFIGKWTIDMPNTPIEFLIDFGFHIGYVSYTGDLTSNEKYYGIPYGGELGIGLQLKRIGLYTILNYSYDALWRDYSNSSTSVERKTFTSMKGLELRFGYNFDLQALFH